MKETAAEAWITGQLALTLLAVDPLGLGGVHLRSRAGPVRDAFMRALPDALTPVRKIAPMIDDTQLFGGIDIAGTLAQGRVVRTRGVLADQATLVLAMAERCGSGLAARLAHKLDTLDIGPLILLDEGVDADERAPPPLTERLAFSLDLDGMRAVDLAEIVLDPLEIVDARWRLSNVKVPDQIIALLTVTAARFGIDSMRAPLLALAATRAHAALAGRWEANEDDAQLAAQLIYPHRATMIPQDIEEQDQDNTPLPDTEDQQSQAPDHEQSLELPQEMLIEAVKALLPPEILAALSAPKAAKGGSGSGGAGARRKGNRRGRPLPSVPGKLDGTSRIDIVATLRAAAPWQPIRRKAQPDAPGLLIRPSDIRLKRYQDLSDRLVIFAVDASGSSAVARLSEAKGAVELMLADAYARRDHVALIAFRGEGAEVILPPTRSLVQTKRRLAGLPGGGGTPLAAGLQATVELARQARGQGLSPSLALLTDGRANVALPGRSGRVAAGEDANSMARVLRGMDLPSAVVDTSVRPQRELQALSTTLGATYVPLPRADAAGLSRAIGSALDG
jgi:magnesium chelatase subunit D